LKQRLNAIEEESSLGHEDDRDDRGLVDGDEIISEKESSHDQQEDRTKVAHKLTETDQNDSKAENKDEDIGDDYSTLSYNELRRSCAAKGFSAKGKAAELRERLRAKNIKVSTNAAAENESANDSDDVADDLSTASYRELQQECKTRGISGKGKRADLLNRLNTTKIPASVAGDVSQVIKEQASDEYSSDSSVVEVITKETEFARICAQAEAENKIRRKPSRPTPRKIATKQVAVKNAETKLPVVSMLSAAGKVVANILSPRILKRKQEVIDLASESGDDDLKEQGAKGDNKVDALASPEVAVPRNITAGSVSSPGDQSIISTLSAADHAFSKPSQAKTGKPPKPKRRKLEKAIDKSAIMSPRKKRSNTGGSSVRSTRSTRSRTKK